ncbi:S46 family peptidase [Streptomyces piniterrae]|uniref:S46 family peptidase n=1 Tax=Streptomyces piniterrae TaxID=2571125 RepID=A0A4U0NFP0_9ACTN|nr:S46 family peptidase [Streptomyces piniterrae]
MPPMVVERRPRREDFSEPCTVFDRTFLADDLSQPPGVHLYVTIRCADVTHKFRAGRKASET